MDMWQSHLNVESWLCPWTTTPVSDDKEGNLSPREQSEVRSCVQTVRSCTKYKHVQALCFLHQSYETIHDTKTQISMDVNVSGSRKELRSEACLTPHAVASESQHSLSLSVKCHFQMRYCLDKNNLAAPVWRKLRLRPMVRVDSCAGEK